MNDRVGQQFGNYRLIRLLGQGGFAEVYLGEHIHLKTLTAIKILYGKMSTHDSELFTKEAQTIATLKHPHILRIFDFGINQTLPYIIMEYASNGSLRDRHPEGSIVVLPTIVSYVKQIASALVYTHAHKLIHRDVKPENILVDADDNLLLGDFGIVAIAHSTTSMKTQDNLGTVHYMAPEHIKKKPRPASDQYALATMVYEWITGENPFAGDSLVEIAMSKFTEDPPTLCDKNPDISPQVEQVVLKGLAKDPQERFPDVEAFAEAFEQACRGKTEPKPVIAMSSPALDNVALDLISAVPAQRNLPPPPNVPGDDEELKRAQSPLAPTQVVQKTPVQALTKRRSQWVGTPLATYHFEKWETPDIQVLAWSPDGTKLAAGGKKTVTVWDTLTRKELFHCSIESSSIAWSPNSRYLAAGYRQSFIYDAWTNQQMIDLQNAKLERYVVERSTSIEKFVWLPDSIHLLSLMSNKQTVTLWNGLRGEPRDVYHVRTKRLHPFGRYLTLSPDGEYFSLVFDTRPTIWNTRTGQLIRIFNNDHYNHGGTTKRASAWSPDGKYIATYDWKHAGHIWDVATGKIVQTWQGHTSSSSDDCTLIWSPDGKYLAYSGEDAIVTIWEAMTGNEVYVYHIPEKEMCTIAWSPDGSCIALGSSSTSSIYVWRAPEVLLEAIPAPVSTFALADVVMEVKDEEEKEVIVSSGVQSLAERLRPKVPLQKTGMLLASYLFETEKIVPETKFLAWSPDGKRLAAAGNYITLWDTLTGKEHFHTSRISHIDSLDWSPDSEYLATGDREIFVYGMIAGQQIARCDPAKLSSVTKFFNWVKQRSDVFARHVNWLPDKDKKRVMVLVGSQQAMVWDVFANRVLKIHKLHIPDECYQWGSDLIISPDGEYFSVGLDARLSIWSTETGELIRVFERAETSIQSQAWSPSGKYIAVCTSNNAGGVWEVSTGMCVQKWEDHFLSLSGGSLAWSPDDEYIAVAGANANVTIWEALTGRKVYVYRGHEREVNAVAWSPDGSQIASGARKEHCVHIWQAPM